MIRWRNPNANQIQRNQS
jgi:hypothetical protein